MRRALSLSLLALAALSAALPAQAQSRRNQAVVQEQPPLVVRVRPRSYLDAGNVVAPGTTTGYATRDIVSYVNSPPYIGFRDRFGGGILPDPMGGPFVGARNSFSTVGSPFP